MGRQKSDDRVVPEGRRKPVRADGRQGKAHYEETFHDASHGFRPGRSCHTAIKQAKEYLEGGHDWVVDIDLEKFFDQVNHDRLVSRLEQRIEDRRVLMLIRQMLKAKVVLPDGVVVANEQGTPQGGPLSPLLSNIVLAGCEDHKSGFVRGAPGQLGAPTRRSRAAGGNSAAPVRNAAQLPRTRGWGQHEHHPDRVS